MWDSFVIIPSFYSLLVRETMYSEEETMRIELPDDDLTLSSFATFIDPNRTTDIKNVIIVQKNYRAYKRYINSRSLVTIPDTITNLTEVEQISITAKVETLPKCLSTLKKLTLLDLSGCYNILEIPPEILAMPNLKIKIGDIISPASEVILILVPTKAISPNIYSVLSNRKDETISPLLISQERAASFLHPQAEIVIPNDVCRMDGLRCIWLRGNITKIPGFIFDKSRNLLSRANARTDSRCQPFAVIFLYLLLF